MQAKPPTLKARLALIGPGLLVAATGVGAGDLATASFTGSQLGTAVLWAVVVGAALKFVLNEGLARWQLVTGESLLGGATRRFGRIVGWLFLPYLVLWSFFVGAALMSACGVALGALVPVFDDAVRAKIVFGIVSSLVGLVLVLAGGFRLFEKIMGLCIALMLVIVVVTAIALWPGTAAVLRGLFVPVIPDIAGQGLPWTVALLGGIGGTLTVLCYGYWIRELGRDGPQHIGICRIDLATGYLVTMLFGIAMVIIGSQVTISGNGAGLLVALADRLQTALGPTARWVFLVGVLGAVFSSLLGVWQSVPYLFADCWQLSFGAQGCEDRRVDTSSLQYRGFLVALAVVPILGLFVGFRKIQMLYAIVGATFMPILAFALLVMNGRREWVGQYANRAMTSVVLLLALAFFSWLGLARFGA